MERGTIYVDFDDILCETARGLMHLAHRMYGWTGDFEDIRDFNLGVSFGLSEGQVDELMHIAHGPEALLKYEPVEGAVSGMGRLSEEGYALAIITGRPVATHDDSVRWLVERSVPYDELLFVDKYGRTNDSLDHDAVISLEQLAQRQFHAAVEDAPAMLDVLYEHMSVPILALARPWNRDVASRRMASNRFLRCRNWAEVVDAVLAR